MLQRVSPTVGRSVLLLFTAGALACTPELGECDQAAATRVAYDPADGRTAYEGQALIISSCGGATLCHGADAEGVRRNGVPAGLELDVRLASTTSAANEAELARLRRGRYLVVQHARSILRTLDLGTMPPRGIDTGALAASYLRSDDTSLPAIDSPEAREVLRNWLACGAPVVERTTARADGVPAVVVPDHYVPPIEPTWASVFRDLLVARRCGNQYCHGDPNAEEVGLHIAYDDCDATYRALVGAAASGEHCGGPFGRALIVPGDPENSVFLQKLTPGSGVCGDPMAALRPEDLAAIGGWIERGAPDGCVADAPDDAGVAPDAGLDAGL